MFAFTSLSWDYHLFSGLVMFLDSLSCSHMCMSISLIIVTCMYILSLSLSSGLCALLSHSYSVSSFLSCPVQMWLPSSFSLFLFSSCTPLSLSSCTFPSLSVSLIQVNYVYSHLSISLGLHTPFPLCQSLSLLSHICQLPFSLFHPGQLCLLYSHLTLSFSLCLHTPFPLW